MAEADQDWVTLRLDEAAKKAPASTAVSAAIKQQLNGVMRERALRPGELTILAKALLALPPDPPLEETPK